MKGLIYREFILIKKNMLFTFAFLVGMLILEILIMLSLRIGNLATITENPVDTAQVCYSLFNMVNTVTAFGIFVADHGVTQSDFQCKWQMFSYTLPISPYQMAGLKTGRLILGFFCGTLLSLASHGLIISVMDEKALQEYNQDFEHLGIYMILMFGLYYTLLENIRIPMILKFHKESTATVATCGIFMLLYIAIMGLMGKIMKDFKAANPDLDQYETSDALLEYVKEHGMNFLHHWGWIFPVLIIVFFAAGYFAIVRILKRRPY